MGNCHSVGEQLQFGLKHSELFLYLNRWRVNVQEWLRSAESRDLSQGDVVWWGVCGGVKVGLVKKKKNKKTKSFTRLFLNDLFKSVFFGFSSDKTWTNQF